MLNKTLALRVVVPLFVPKLVPEWGLAMAGKLRYWKEKDGRFWARIAVPVHLRPFLDNPRSELIEPLGGDRRAALRLHSAAVARLQLEITAAKQHASSTNPAPLKPALPRTAITTADIGRAVWQRYLAALEADDAKREQFPSNTEIDSEYDRIMERIDAGEISGSRDPIGMINAYSDYEMMLIARRLDSKVRERRLALLLSGLASGVTNHVDADVRQYITENNLIVEPGSGKWRELAHVLTRAEIQALKRTIERDAGDYSGQPTDSIVKAPAGGVEAIKPVGINALWSDYVKSRVVAGFMKDGGIRQRPVIENLLKFLGHNDARQVTRRDLLDWRDKLLKTLSAKTTNDIYLSTVRSMLKWAHDEERLPENIAATVRQSKPKKQRVRDPGYSDKEALTILRATRAYEAKPDAFGVVREKEQSVAAKRWVPLLCAFAGARVGEMLQLRKEDVREENGRWIIRITPEAGTMKAGHFRDLPLHKQVIDMGFVDHVQATKSGPLFHGSPDPAKAVSAARAQSNKIAGWLHEAGLVPDGLQPSHAWRHRFKGQARELGLDMRVTDAIQGHAGKSAADDYGDISLVAKARIIDALPYYDLSNKAE